MNKLPNHPLSRTALRVALALTLTGCGSAKLLVDDGRRLDARMLGEVRTYGAAAASLRPAVARAGALADPECSTQYELPFEASSSYFFKDENLKMAMIRELGVNEYLTVLAADASTGLARGETISRVRGYQSANTAKLITELFEARDDGKPFKITMSSGKELAIVPLKVCRGRAYAAAPDKSAQQHYHWTSSVHPLEVFKEPLTPDEAAWVVLWTQGLSEEGGARMKTFSFAVGSVTMVAYAGLAVATAGAAVVAGSSAAAAGATVGTVMGQMAAPFVVGAALKGATLAAGNKANLSGINRVAAGVFDKADAWTFENMKKLGMDPRAGLSLNARLERQGAGNNAFLLDEERLARMQALVAELPKPVGSGADQPPAVVAEGEPPVAETFPVDGPSDAVSPAN